MTNLKQELKLLRMDFINISNMAKIAVQRIDHILEEPSLSTEERIIRQNKSASESSIFPGENFPLGKNMTDKIQDQQVDSNIPLRSFINETNIPQPKIISAMDKKHHPWSEEDTEWLRKKINEIDPATGKRRRMQMPILMAHLKRPKTAIQAKMQLIKAADRNYYTKEEDETGTTINFQK